MDQAHFARTCPAPRDYWPLIRLLVVLTTFGLWGHWRFGWNEASLPAIEKGLAGMLGVFCFCGLISYTLGRFYAMVVIFPFYATTVLNDWLYAGCYWLFRTILRLLYIRRVSAFAALVGELSLFVVLWRLVEIILRKYGL